MVGVSYCWGFIVRIFEYNMTYEIHTHTKKIIILLLTQID